MSVSVSNSETRAVTVRTLKFYQAYKIRSSCYGFMEVDSRQITSHQRQIIFCSKKNHYPEDQHIFCQTSELLCSQGKVENQTAVLDVLGHVKEKITEFVGVYLFYNK